MKRLCVSHFSAHLHRMAFPFANTWTNWVINIFPFVALIALFGVAIWAQLQGCEKGKGEGGLSALLVPRLTAPYLIG